MIRGIMTALVVAGVMAFAPYATAQKATTPTTDAINLNSSRSNVSRMGGGGGTTKPKTPTDSQTGAPPGIAVSDPGVPGSNPNPKPKNK
jgi:hypothetical protein